VPRGPQAVDVKDTDSLSEVSRIRAQLAQLARCRQCAGRRRDGECGRPEDARFPRCGGLRCGSGLRRVPCRKRVREDSGNGCPRLLRNLRVVVVAGSRALGMALAPARGLDCEGIRYAARLFAAVWAKLAMRSASRSGWSIIENVLAFSIISSRLLGRASASRCPSSRGKKTSSADHATSAGLVNRDSRAAARTVVSRFSESVKRRRSLLTRRLVSAGSTHSATRSSMSA